MLVKANHGTWGVDGQLHGIVRVTQRAEHPVGHCSQVTPMGLELVRQQFLFVHPSHFLVASRHSSDE